MIGIVCEETEEGVEYKVRYHDKILGVDEALKEIDNNGILKESVGFCMPPKHYYGAYNIACKLEKAIEKRYQSRLTQ